MKLLMAALATTLLCACAAEVVRQSSVMSAPSAAGSYRSSAMMSFTLDSGYSRNIPAGAEFVLVGVIPEGRVLKPIRTVVTIEGAHMHEAYPVERDGRLVGFYLPVEKAFSPLSNPVTFPLQGESPK